MNLSGKSIQETCQACVAAVDQVPKILTAFSGAFNPLLHDLLPLLGEQCIQVDSGIHYAAGLVTKHDHAVHRIVKSRPLQGKHLLSYKRTVHNSSFALCVIKPLVETRAAHFSVAVSGSGI